MNENEQIQQLKEIATNFEKEVAEIIQTALSSPKGGDAAWYQLANQYDVDPSTENQKILITLKGCRFRKEHYQRNYEMFLNL
jgi:hypothetical protein